MHHSRFSSLGVSTLPTISVVLNPSILSFSAFPQIFVYFHLFTVITFPGVHLFLKITWSSGTERNEPPNKADIALNVATVNGSPLGQQRFALSGRRFADGRGTGTLKT